MFKRLLVPLDGSQLAEAVLPAARYLAQTCHAAVTLLHVVEVNAPEQVHGQPHLAQQEEAEVYLAKIAHSFPAELSVTPHVHFHEERNVAQTIVNHAQELAVDVIVMCAHGRGGVRTLLFGSIAQQVIALGETPVYLINPSVGRSVPPVACRRFVAPLDGNAEHAQGLAVAMELAEVCNAEVHLLMVVPTLTTLANESMATARFLPGATAALLDLTEDAAAQYLQHQVAELTDHAAAISTAVRRGDPATVIVRYARQQQADLIILGTHGQSHLDAFWSGSTTLKVSARAQMPLLLVPVRAAHPTEPR